MPESLRGHLAIVTGADGGIGKYLLRALGERGIDVVMISNRQETLKQAAADFEYESGVKVYPFCCDLTQPDAHVRVMEFVDAAGLKPDILINNAGIFSFDMVTGMPEGKINAFLDLHCRSVTLLSRAFAQRFAEQGGGRILNMSSMSCWMPMPGIAMYSATKAYIRAFSRALNYEMRDSGVTVTVACPGGVATSLFGLPENMQKLAVRLGVLQTPRKLAQKLVKKMLKGKPQYINGLLNRVAIVAVGVTPDPVRMLVKRKMLDRGIRR